MDPMMLAFLQIDSLPEGHRLELDYTRMIGFYAGRDFKISIGNNWELKSYQRHLGELEDSADALMINNGFRYRIDGIKYSPDDIEIPILKESKPSGVGTNYSPVVIHLLLGVIYLLLGVGAFAYIIWLLIGM